MIFVDKDTVADLNTGVEKLEDILVLHLTKGKDFFISFSPTARNHNTQTARNHNTQTALDLPVQQRHDLIKSPYVESQRHHGNVTKGYISLSSCFYNTVDSSVL